ncbi:MAG: class I SAM-dependent methyltransferase [Nocardioides sp.]|uniref:class I SAM-dependent methyltransferase n=1 Tax=Nocardioides sp. TaxID=35761 RepID=UPI003F00B9FC
MARAGDNGVFDRHFFYEVFPDVEPAFGDALDAPSAARGPEVLLQVVEELGLAPDSRAVDVGCGTGEHAFALATLYGFRVLGLDPVQRHLDLARAARREQADPIATRVAFERGSAAHLPVHDAGTDLVWCHDVLPHVDDVGAALREFARVLRPGGYVVAHQVLAAPSFSGADAEWLLAQRGMVPGSVDPRRHEEAIAASGLEVIDSIDLGSEWGERAERADGAVSRAMLRVARMRREPDQWRTRFGAQAFDAMLATSMWQVHRLLGDLPGRLDVLVRPR